MDLLPLLGYYSELRLIFTKNKYELLINAPPPPKQKQTNKKKMSEHVGTSPCIVQQHFWATSDWPLIEAEIRRLGGK